MATAPVRKCVGAKIAASWIETAPFYRRRSMSSRDEEIAKLLARQRDLVEGLEPLVDRTNAPSFEMEDSEFASMDKLSRELEHVNNELARLGRGNIRPGPKTSQ